MTLNLAQKKEKEMWGVCRYMSVVPVATRERHIVTNKTEKIQEIIIVVGLMRIL